MSHQIVVPFHSISLTIIVIMIWYENWQIRHHQHYHTLEEHDTRTSTRNRLLLAMAGSIFRFRFASHDIHRRTHTQTHPTTEKRRKIHPKIHNILCCRTENAQANNDTKSAECVIGRRSHGLVCVVVMLDHKCRFCGPWSKKRHFHFVAGCQSSARFISHLLLNSSCQPVAVWRGAFYITQSATKKFIPFRCNISIDYMLWNGFNVFYRLILVGSAFCFLLN